MKPEDNGSWAEECRFRSGRRQLAFLRFVNQVDRGSGNGFPANAMKMYNCAKEVSSRCLGACFSE
jgi:hypothetical protein